VNAGQPGVPAPTVVWWREDRGGRLVELLIVGPGPTTVADQIWPRVIATSATGAVAWSLFNTTALGPLAPELAARARSAAVPVRGAGDGSLSVAVLDERHGDLVAEGHGLARDPLFDACRRAALELVDRRLHEATVVDDPFSGGVLLARLHRLTGGAVLELAPARVRDDRPVTATPVWGVSDGERELTLGAARAGTVDVALGDDVAARLPSARLPIGGDLGADAATAPLTVSLDVSLSRAVALPRRLQARLRAGPDGVPLVRMPLVRMPLDV